MFGGSKELVASLLKDHVGKYVEIDTDNVALSLWDGVVELENLELKPEALKSLNLPIKVVSGRISKLSLKIPWTTISTEAVVLNIDGIFCTVEPSNEYTNQGAAEADEGGKDDGKSDPKGVELKRAKLKDIEKKTIEEIEQARTGADVGDGKTSSFLQRLTMKVVNNLQININKLHIQLKDRGDITLNGFTFGFILEHLSVVSTNESWKVVFVEGNKQQGEVYKILEMKKFGFYFACGNPEKQEKPFFENVFSSQNTSHPYFILEPVSLLQKLKIDNRPSLHDSGGPKFTGDLKIQQIIFSMTHEQYSSLLDMLGRLDKYLVTQKYLQYKPASTLIEDPRAWWHFAFNAVLHDFRAERKEQKRKMEVMLKRSKYVHLYKSSLSAIDKIPGHEAIDSTGWKKLEDLEDDPRLRVEDILHFRRIGEAELLLTLKHYGKSEGHDYTTIKDRVPKLQPRTSSSSSIFFSSESSQRSISAKKKGKKTESKSVWGRFKSFAGYGEKESPEIEADDSEKDTEDVMSFTVGGTKVVEIDQNVRKQIFENVGFDPEVKAEEFPPLFLITKFNFTIVNIGVRLYKGKDALLSLDLYSANVKVDYRQGKLAEEKGVPALPNININANISEIQAMDCMSEVDMYTKILGKQKTNESENIFDLNFEINPVSEDADSILKAKLMPHEIILSKSLLDRIVAFFSNEDHDLSNITEAASNAISSSVQDRREKIEELIASQYNMSISLELNAPLVKVLGGMDAFGTVPELLQVDFGQFTMDSDRAAGSQDSALVHDQRYDYFNVVAKNIQVQVLDIDGKDSVDSVTYPLPILTTNDELKASLLFCRLPTGICESEDLVQSFADVSIPQINLSMSKTVLEKLKRILNTFSQEDNSASGTVAAEATEEDPKEASLEIKDVKVEDIQESVERSVDASTYFKSSFKLNLNSIHVSWEKCVNQSEREFDSVLSIVLDFFDADIFLSHVQQTVKLKFHELSMTQHMKAVQNDEAVDFHIVSIQSLQSPEASTEPFCDLVLPRSENSHEVPVQAKVTLGFVRVDCDANRLFKLMTIYEDIIQSVQLERPELDIPDVKDVSITGGTKAHIRVRGILLNLSGHENGRERPVVKAKIDDLEISFFSYDDGGKLLLRACATLDHFDTHAVVWQPALEPLVLHADGRFPSPSSENKDVQIDLRSESEIVVNISTDFLKDINIVTNELSSLKTMTQSITAADNFSPYVLHNKCGLPLKMWFPRTDEFRPTSKNAVDTSEAYNFSLPPSRQARADFLGLGQQRSRINVHIEGFEVLKDISIDTIGTHYYILYSEGESPVEHLLQWTITLNAGAREIFASSALSLKNCSPWAMEAQASSGNLLDEGGQAEARKLLPGDTIYAPIAIAHDCHLDARLKREKTDWGVVDSEDSSFLGLNAPISTFAKKTNYAVLFFSNGVPLYGVVLKSKLGEHSETFQHMALELHPAVKICNSLAQKITLVLHDRNTNEPTEMKTILPGEELCPRMLRRGIKIPSKRNMSSSSWHPLSHLLKPTHVKFILNGFEDAPFLPLVYPQGHKLQGGEKAKHNVQILDETGNDCNMQVHYSLPDVESCSVCLEISCAYWLVNLSGLPLIYSKACVSAKSEIEIASGQCFPVVEEVYENQRYYALIGWTRKMLPGERYSWSDKAGTCKEARTRESVKLPNRDTWEWQNEWTVDMSFGDNDGWGYASINFNNIPYREKTFPAAVVRRRRWIRTRKPTDVHTNLKSVCMYSPNPSQKKASLFRMRVWDSCWSQAIDLNAVGTKGVVSVKARDERMEFQFIISISIPPTSQLFETKLVTVVSRYIIVNKTMDNIDLLVGQFNKDGLHRRLRGHTTLAFEEQKPFHWSNGKESKLISVLLREKNKDGVEDGLWSEPFSIEEVGQYSVLFKDVTILTKKNRTLRVEVKPTDTSVVVIFSAASVDLTPEQVEVTRRATRLSSIDHVVPEFRFSLSIYMIQLSLLDVRRTEIALLKVSNSHCSFSTLLGGPLRTQSMELKVGEVEIDNMTPAPYYPVAFRSKNAMSDDTPPFLHITVIKEEREEDGSDIVYIPYFMFALQTVDVRTDERFITRVLEIVEELGYKPAPLQIHEILTEYVTVEDSQFAIQAAIGLQEGGKKHFQQKILEVEEVGTSKRYCFEVFQINPLQINLSFKLVGNFKVTRFDAIKNVLMDLKQCPFRLNALVISQSIGTVDRLATRIIDHYKHSVIRQLYKVIGSISMLGKPIGFVGSLGTGVKTFFVEPAKAIRKGPKDFATGMRKGTYGLLSNTFEGLGTAAGAFAGTVGDGVAQLTFDQEFLAERQKRDQAVSEGGFKNGMFYGAKAFGSSIASGITGLATAPIKGAKQDGLKGFVKGIGKGVVGVPTKVLSGALEAVSHAAEGAANSAINQREGKGTVRRRAQRATRVRRRRLLQGPERALVVWVPMENLVRETLERLGIRSGDDDEIDRRKQEKFLYYLVLGKDIALFLTTKKIYLIQENAEAMKEYAKKHTGADSNGAAVVTDSTIIQWKESFFADSRFVVVSHIVSIFARLYEVIGTNIEDISAHDKTIVHEMVRLKDVGPEEAPYNLPEHLQISDWKAQIFFARKISHLVHPKQNLESFRAILESINDEFSKKTENGLGGADELLPIIEYIACQSRIRKPTLCIKLIKIICDSEMSGAGGYAIATFESCFKNLANRKLSHLLS
jgi:hypothetical protein